MGTTKRTGPIKQCVVCGNSFQGWYKNSVEKTCSPECGRKKSHITRGGNPWRDEEVELLRESLGSVYSGTLMIQLSDMAKENGWPSRSDKSVMSKFASLSREEGDGSIRPDIDSWPISTMFRLFGTTRHTTDRWVKKGLKRHRVGFRVFVTRKDLRRFAKKHPSEFCELSEDTLLFFFEDIQFIEDLKLAKPLKKREKRKVLCVSTGDEYDDLWAAAKAHFVTYTAIANAARGDVKTSAGLEWRYIDNAS